MSAFIIIIDVEANGKQFESYRKEMPHLAIAEDIHEYINTQVYSDV